MFLNIIILKSINVWKLRNFSHLFFCFDDFFASSLTAQHPRKVFSLLRARAVVKKLYTKHQNEEIHTKKAHNKNPRFSFDAMIFFRDEAIIKRKTQESKKFFFLFHGASIFLDARKKIV